LSVEPGHLVREAKSGFDWHVTKPMTPAVHYNILQMVRLWHVVSADNHCHVE